MSRAEGAAGSLLESGSFRRFLLGSSIGHLVLGAVLLVAPTISHAPLAPVPIYVDLVSRPKPKAPPKAATKKAPKVRQTLDQPVVLKTKPAPKKPTPKAAPKPEPAEAPAKIPSAAEILAQLREKAESEAETEAASQPTRPGRFDPELAAYHRRIRTLLRANWGGAGAFKARKGLVARFEVDLDATGRIRSLSSIGSSGDSFFDGSAERAIRSSDPFPAPPRGPITLDLVFNPEGVF
jgi:colicin import membrane protein